MTSHQLAKWLLSKPNVPAFIPKRGSKADIEEVTIVHLASSYDVIEGELEPTTTGIVLHGKQDRMRRFDSQGSIL